MLPQLILCLFLLLPACLARTADRNYEYCIVGAGPSGLQLGHFLQSVAASYVILERSNVAGSFFVKYPRHGKLISINKRWTDSSNTEYSLRHDWNSLLTIDNNSAMLFRHYSSELFPSREAMVTYLNDYRGTYNLTVHFNTTVTSVNKLELGAADRDTRFLLSTTGPHGDYACQVVVMATGLPNLRPVDFPGHEYTVGYDQVSINKTDFEGKRVLIIGKGNSGFETAQHVYGHTKLIHLVSRSSVRFSWSTHYVGDLRAVNNELLDTYQLKSLDGNFEFDTVTLEKNAKGEICMVKQQGDLLNSILNAKTANGPFDDPRRQFCYDMVVRATGFVWDSSPTAPLNVTSSHRGKYPVVGYNFESVDTPGLYFAGGTTHSLDFRSSAGGFVHGFRYTARALFRMLRVQRHGEKWQSQSGPVSGMLDAMVKRINEGSGNYQMFAFLGDVFLLNQNKTEFVMIEEMPVRLLHKVTEITGHPATGSVFVFVFEYGKYFSGPRADTFREDRASCDSKSAYKCNFLHPVIYQYDMLPKEPHEATDHNPLPKPDRLLHLAEDFYTNFRQLYQIVPLAAFLESCLARPAAALSAEQCALRGLLNGQWPSYCPEFSKSPPANRVLDVWSI